MASTFRTDRFYRAKTQTPERALRYRDAGTVGAVYWADRRVSYVVTGPAERQRLQGVAQSAYDQLETRPASAPSNS